MLRAAALGLNQDLKDFEDSLLRLWLAQDGNY